MPDRMPSFNAGLASRPRQECSPATSAKRVDAGESLHLKQKIDLTYVMARIADALSVPLSKLVGE
jgi:hypothetical protein